VWGENSKAIFELVERAKSGSFIWASEGKIPFESVHILNLINAIVLAIQHGTGKNVYFVTDDEESSVRDFFSRIFEAYGVPQPRRSLPTEVIRLAASLTESIWSMLAIKSKPPITRFEWAFVGMPRKYSVAKIKGDLGYKPKISRQAGFRQLELANVTDEMSEG
jgi:nucleoside-diphosphate-sugar epimerase